MFGRARHPPACASSMSIRSTSSSRSTASGSAMKAGQRGERSQNIRGGACRKGQQQGQRAMSHGTMASTQPALSQACSLHILICLSKPFHAQPTCVVRHVVRHTFNPPRPEQNTHNPPALCVMSYGTICSTRPIRSSNGCSAARRSSYSSPISPAAQQSK